MPSNQTANYQLSQWAKSDQVRMEDFNADNAKIDAAIKAEADARTAETAALTAAVQTKADASALAALAAQVPATHLSCYASSYVGSGNGTQTFTFPGKPWLVITIMGPYGGFAIRGGSDGTLSGVVNITQRLSASWSGNSVTLYHPSGYVSALNTTSIGMVFALIET